MIVRDVNLDEILSGYDPYDFPDGWTDQAGYQQPPSAYVDQARGLLQHEEDPDWSRVHFLAFALKDIDEAELEASHDEYEASRS